MISSKPTITEVEVLRARFTPARFDKYVVAAQGDPVAALRLYEWNALASGALFVAIGQFEVLLRNALDVELCRYHRKVMGGDGSWWRDQAMPLQADLADRMSDARRRAVRGGATETHGKVIAELMFGFWRFLLDARHSPTLWAPALRHAFPHLRPKVRTEVYDRVERLNALRNRVAHHEPIHQGPLEERWRDLLTVAGWICPTTAAWIGSSSTVPAVLAAKP
jgi:hypothetical protein